MIDLVPTSSLMESKTDFVSPSLSLILSQFGGALGLWLGLGVTQLVQVKQSLLFFLNFNTITCIKTNSVSTLNNNSLSF